MLKTVKGNIESLIRSAACSLRQDRFRAVLKSCPDRFLHIFDHPSARDRYAEGGRALPPSLWDIVPGPEGQMMLQGVDCLKLAEEHGTPLYVVDRSRLSRNYTEFRDSFASRYPRVEIAYSYKTNPLPGVLMALNGLGAGAEVVSGFELWLALKLGVSPDQIVFNGPGKTRDALKLAVSRNIKLINIDGELEMNAINRFAGESGRRQQVGVRVVTSVGWQEKFGFSLESGAAFDAYQRLKCLNNVDPVGMHVHIGLGNNRPGDYAGVVREMCRLAKLLEERLGIAIRYFDFGGGYETARSMRGYNALEQKLFRENLPVQEARICHRHSPSEYAKAIVDVLDSFYPPDSAVARPTILLEPGKAITSTAQMALLKVLDLKSSVNGIRNVIVDGGRSFAAPLEWECHELLHATRLTNSPEGYYRIFGPTCTPYDVLYQVKRLPSLQRGDVLAVMDAGAYFVPMQANFSFPRAAAVMVDDGSHWLIREREEYEDIVGKDVLPDPVYVMRRSSS